MKRELAILVFAAALIAFAGEIAAQETHAWREFKKSDGLAENSCISVTIGSGGNVFVRHRNENAISVLDGYRISLIPAPDTDRSRIYESPGGQLWSVARDGLLEFHDGKWLLHAIPEFTNPVSVQLVRQSHALILLADRLLLANAENPDGTKIQIIRRAVETRLGAFIEMNRARDGALWISGQRGIAKSADPQRSLKPESRWTELLPPEDLKIQNFSIVQEDRTGDITALAESIVTRAPVLVRYHEQRWTVRELNVEKLRFAWRASDRTWIATGNALFELLDDGAMVIRKDFERREILDVAVEPDGAFWLAISDGLFRHAPLIWQTPEPASGRAFSSGETSGDISTILETIRAGFAGRVPADDAPETAVSSGNWTTFLTAHNGDLWLGGGNQIAWRHEKSWQIFSSTNQIGPEDIVCFAEALDGRVWCATANKVWEFDGKNWIAMRGGFQRIHDLHCSRDGTLWVASEKGVHRFWHGAWIANEREDGLPSEVVRQIFEDQRGRIWAETSGSVSLYVPSADTDAPETFVQTKEHGGQTFREGSSVTFSFSGRDKWNQTGRNRLLFSYRLDDREWSPFQEASEPGFNDLSVGKHLFQVRAMDRNGNIDPKPARLEFTVVLPWYREARLVWILEIALAVAIFFAALAINRHHKLRLSYAEVEKKIAERTKELEIANRELLHSQKMNALGSLAAGIAHDFNNILSIVKGSAQIIEENAENPQKVQIRVDRIKTVVQQGAEIVDAMLGFSRGSDSPSALCNLNAVIGDTMKLLGDRFLREVEVRFERDENLPEISLPKDFVQQILLNFIFNAAEAMTNKKHITLSTRTTEKLPPEIFLTPSRAASYILVSVRDCGSGIAPEIKPRIFEPFFTTKALSTKRGTGLGLSMVYELAKKMDAGLAVESAVGQGSTFTLILPVHAAAPTQTKSQTAVYA